MTLNTQWQWRDGLATFYYGGYLVMIGGWNPTGGVFTPGPSTNQIWVSADDGLTWTYLGDAPWSIRHSFGCEIIGTTLYIFGSDSIVPTKDIWTYDLTQGVLNLAVALNWTEETSNWGAVGGDRILFSWFVYNGKIRMAGGQNDETGTTMYTDVVELNTSTWTWANVGTLPISYASSSILVQQGSVTYLYAGGRYVSGSDDNLNNNLFSSTNGGNTWSLVDDLPVALNGLMYANGCSFDNKLWFLNGSLLGVNQAGLWYYTNGNWIKKAETPLSRHASYMCTNGSDKMFIVSGNGRNDVIRITKTTL